MIEEMLVPRPRETRLAGGTIPRPKAVSVLLPLEGRRVLRDAARLAEDLSHIAGIDARIGIEGAYPVRLALSPGEPQPEGYRRRIADNGIDLIGADVRGLFYAEQTLLQILALSGDEIELLEIRDWPRYRRREVMVDMGCAPYSTRLLKRIVRIMARLNRIWAMRRIAASTSPARSPASLWRRQRC